MKIVLTAINAKYIHSNLAVHSLKASAGKYESMIDLAEYTINHQMDDIFAAIYKKRPDLLLLSCYIWNRNEVLELASMIRKVLPDVRIWAGGPEVTYDAVRFLEENTDFDGVMMGEGELTLYRLLEYFVDHTGALSDIPGIAWREEEHREIRKNPPAPPMRTLDGLPFVYRDLSKFENRILYYESSRGCPFSCSYCLSSVDKTVRYRSMELVKQELQWFLDNKVKQVKFVDRTFNCSHARTLELWSYLRDHDNGITNFHCEVSADLLNEEELQVLSGMRPGLLQLEIGVQTVNPDTLRAIHRTAPFEKIAEHVRKIQQARNIHLHLDLIAGLPCEDFESFRNSFDTVYRLYPEELQLGFLKVLQGSEMYRRAEEYGIVYRDRPPYEVLETKWISCGQLLRLKEIEEMLEVYYNSQQFRNTMRAAETLFERPIELYEALADYYSEQQLTGKSYSRAQRFEILREFLLGRCEETDRNYFEELLLLDLYLRENAKSRPSWAPDQTEIKEQAVQFYQEEEQQRQLLPELSQMSWKQLMRMTHIERFNAVRMPGAGTAAVFDYSRRDPLTGDARIIWIDLPAR